MAGLIASSLQIDESRVYVFLSSRPCTSSLFCSRPFPSLRSVAFVKFTHAPPKPESARPGHRLIMAQPDADGGELDEGEIVGGVLLVPGGDGAEVLELVEEALDEVPVAVQEGAEGGGVHACAAWA